VDVKERALAWVPQVMRFVPALPRVEEDETPPWEGGPGKPSIGLPSNSSPLEAQSQADRHAETLGAGLSGDEEERRDGGEQAFSSERRVMEEAA
jgi:hypothetical protein